MKIRKEFILLGLCGILLLTGCGGKTANTEQVESKETTAQWMLDEQAAKTEQETETKESQEAAATGEKDTNTSDESKEKKQEKKEAKKDTGKDTGKETKQDKYQTDPVPEGKPEPVEPQDVKVEEEETLTCTIEINCETALAVRDQLTEEKQAVIPDNGLMLKKTKVKFSKGESVYTVLQRITKKKKIQMESTMTPVYNSAYIEGIGNLYEFDCGELSGWMYSVNDWYPNYGCSRYELEDGDTIRLVYTCDLGRDLGQEGVVQQ